MLTNLQATPITRKSHIVLYVLICHSPSGQLSNTVCAISPAESDGLNRNSFVLPLTSIKRKFICKRTGRRGKLLKIKC